MNDTREWPIHQYSGSIIWEAFRLGGYKAWFVQKGKYECITGLHPEVLQQSTRQKLSKS